MAIVTGPLHSDDARGQIGKSLVFMGWKGIKTVRSWLKPANPQDPDQGDIRCLFGGTGRAVGRVKVDESYDTKLKALGVIPSAQSKQSYLVQYIKGQYFTGKGATMKANYATALKELTGHTAYTTFSAKATAIGIVDFELSYDTVATYEKGLGFYLLAKAAIALGFTGSPYTKTLASWTATQIGKLASDLRG